VSIGPVPDPTPALHLTGVSKSYAGTPVLRGAHLEVRPGEVVALLGANGAGKSTLLSIAAGILAPDAGRVMLYGAPVHAARRRLLGVAPQRLGIYPTLSVMENVVALATLHGLSPARARANATRVLEELALRDMAHRIAGTLSGGQQRRLHTAMALAHQPRLVFLDEPTVGADAASRERIVGYVRTVAACGAAVVYTTHHLDEVTALEAHVAVLENGQITRHARAGQGTVTAHA